MVAFGGLRYFVADPELGMKELRLDSYPAEHPDTIHGSAQPRQWLKLASFDEARREKNRELNDLASSQDAGMMIEEFIGARLYTGPCFVKYNTTLRGLQSSIAFFKRRFESLCKGNRYTTTLHVINSAIVKLSKLTQATYVYRGVAGGRLPKHFRVANEYGVRGGIDPAFMSTTLDRQVALTYASSSSGPGVVFSMRQGMVDRGADIGWLSQARCTSPLSSLRYPLSSLRSPLSTPISPTSAGSRSIRTRRRSSSRL